MRGHVISYLSHRRKKFQTEFETLHHSLLTAQKEHMNSRDDNSYQTFTTAKPLLNTFVHTHAHWQTQLTKNKFYRWENKTGL
ncbi:hypothetical protein GDO78_009850 [Eleutherodactylus coqui]|uniref:Uncharacterized protein n=1 Tax=Eleutherodactylus coqui TaxID=57060 RepID=A0A8J6K7Z9_ELECQ|nr:hypothetical protein GDO78_009850 [Eleutherodactylus coqui]